MVVNARSLKRVKRRVKADLSDFLTFPTDADRLSGAGGSFRLSIREFLSRHAHMPSLFPHLVTWQVLFRVGDLTAPESADGSPIVVGVDVVEEDVSRSRSVYCDQCRVVGWSGHPVCTKRYHIIVKRDGTSIGGHVKPCLRCGYDVHLSEPRCKSCNNVMTSECVEDWMYQQLEDTSHLLHGVIHENGYGHLLRINGREGGSKFLSGFHIMDFWDRLCKYLRVRKISVMDVSKKYGLEYRLLHAITKGHPWYGNWGYEFGAGSFALTQESYQDAVATLSSLPLSTYISQGRKPRTRVQDLILFYQSVSEVKLTNLMELFEFLMGLVHSAPNAPLAHEEETLKKRRLCASNNALSSWTSFDVEQVEAAIVRVLMAVSRSNWVSWRNLRAAVCRAGPPGVIDHCVKELVGRRVADNLFVHARPNAQSGALEYRLETGDASLVGRVSSTNKSPSKPLSKDHVMNDLRFLYESLLLPQTMMIFGPESKRKLAITAASQLLDCKQFMKNYTINAAAHPPPDSSHLHLFCKLEVVDQDAAAIDPPPELIVLPQAATISDLKRAAANTFREIYIIFRSFSGEELVDYSLLEDSTHLNLLVRSFQTVTIRGSCNLKNGLGRFQMERGLERWTVDCSCGARDDDGERMLACDACGVWQHTRCVGFLDSDAVPARFVCIQCKGAFGRRCIGGGGKSLPRCFVVADGCT